jgi:hypothetical protein
MTNAEVTAESFLNVLNALPKAERDAVIVRMAHDESIVRDLLDLATIEERREESGRPFREFLAEKRGK